MIEFNSMIGLFFLGMVVSVVVMAIILHVMKLENIDSIKLASLLKEKKLRYSLVIFKEEINHGLEVCEKITHCYCGEEIEEGDFCSKECRRHYFDQIT